MEPEYLDEELQEHGVTRRDADFVLQSDLTVEEQMEDGTGGTLRIMFVGFDSNGRLLEIGVEYRDNRPDLIFHGNHATPYYARLFEETNR